MSGQVTDRHPPAWMLRILNPVMRRVLSSRLGARVPMGLLRVTGRRTGRRYEIPVGVWETGDGFVIFSDAPWLRNFRGGAVAELVLRGQTRPVHGQVVDDPARIGAFMRNVMSAGTPARQLGLSMPAGHVITDDEAAAVRSVLLLRPAPAG